MKVWYLIIISCLFYSCANNQRNFERKSIQNSVGSKVKKNLLVGSGQIENNCYDVVIERINYTICYDEQNKVKYISTMDTNFTSIDGVKVGMKFSNLPKKIRKNVYLENGWAYIVPLKHGWSAAIEMKDFDSKIMSNDSTVNWIFKR